MREIGIYLRKAVIVLKNAKEETYDHDRTAILTCLLSVYSRLKVLIHIGESYNAYYWALPMFKKTLRNVDVIRSILINKINKDNIEQCKNTIAAWIEYYARFYEENTRRE